MIERLDSFPENVLAFVCHGQVTKQDYAMVLIPAVENALDAHEKVRLYYETADDFSGIEPTAVWEDAKVGVSHLSRWEKFAIVTDVEWIKHTMQFFGFLLPGEMRLFSTDNVADARHWITE